MALSAVDLQPFLPSFHGSTHAAKNAKFRCCLPPPLFSSSPVTSQLLKSTPRIVACPGNGYSFAFCLWATFNTLGQNACTVAAYLMGTCNGGAFTIDALQPGYSYTGPSGVDDANLCKCNTVTYNLISACDACQSATWITWSEYSFNCTRTLPPSTFPNAVPPGTLVPQWALLDHTNENLWNATKAFVVGDTPEIQPGSLISTGTASSVSGSDSSTTSTASRSGSTASRSESATSSSTSSSPTSSSGSKSNTGAIAGGVAGGVVAVAAVVGLLFFFLRRRPHPQAPSAAFVVDGATPPPSAAQHMSQVQQVQMNADDGTSYVPGTPVTPMKFYDPNDPSTYPGYQSVPSSTPDVHVPVAPYEGSLNGNTLASMQTTRPQGYHGLPTV
ncbi:hypothetical protein EDB87DRAFT_1580479 [Lactarius vividus]|nr:hypothetical protein EDB87DRAFT_1580479 [Lactarius vividus]